MAAGALSELNAMLESSLESDVALGGALRQADREMSVLLARAGKSYCAARAVLDCGCVTGAALAAAERAAERAGACAELRRLVTTMLCELDGLSSPGGGTAEDRSVIAWAADHRVLARAEEDLLREVAVTVLAGPDAKGTTT